MVNITFLGAARIVTGSCYLFEHNKTKFLVDCGMFQGEKETVKRNYLPFEFNPKDISFVLLTHAHIDHCGLIPKLVKEGFKGKIYTTSATKDLCKIMLEDSANIQKDAIEHENKRRLREGEKPREPLYEMKDAKAAMNLFSSVVLNKKYKIGDIETVFRNAGHILGSAIIEIFIEGKKLVFSGDLGQDSSLILKDPDIITSADYLFMESTYGNRLHVQVDKRLEKLARVITETHKKGGKLIIPIFAVERTQELLYSIEELYKKRMIPFQKVFLDTPLGIKATEVFRKHPKDCECSMKLNFRGLEFTREVKDSMKINAVNGPAIIMAGAGMVNAGRVRHHVKHQIWNKRNTILFVGYQAKGTLGQVISSGEKNIKMMGMELKVQAKIESLDSFSGHADQRMLLKWVKCFENKPKKVFVCHSEEDAATVLSQKIEALGIKTLIPNIGLTIKI